MAGAALFSLVAASPAHAAKADGPKARLFAKFDQNKNGVIDGAEKEAVRKDYAADKEGAFKKYDTDQNSKLSDEEIAAIKPPGKGKKADPQAKEGKAKNPETTGKSKKAENGDKPDKPEKKSDQ